MATQVMGQSPGGGGLFPGSGAVGMALPNDMYDLPDLSRAELAAPQLIMLANVALTGEVSGGCCDYLVGEERQMAELMPVGDNSFSESDGEGLEESPDVRGEARGLESMELEGLEPGVVEPGPECAGSAAPEAYSSRSELPPEAPVTEDRCKSLRTKPFRCKPCQYEAESEEQFVHHIRVHSAKKFFVEESAEKQARAREAGSAAAEEGDFSKGPIRCDRCGYNTNRYDHYAAHLKHHTRAGENERVYRCIICTYTTVSEYHWRKHLRNHFPRKVYTCGKCNYFSDRKNNYVQHVRTHTGERPYKCELCPYSSSQKTHLTRHMRTHSGEKPFKCDQCSYVASNQHEVTRHARQVHNGPKPLSCPHCDYKTADRSNFKKHVELHVNPRQFNCPVCDYAASKKCNLQYHFKSKHPTCPSKTMDVSKVKLKKTKKREADLPDDKITSEKTETEQAKIKGDVAGKKNEKSVRVERKENVSKEKKPCSNASSQVTTRTRKSAMDAKDVEAHPGNRSEATCTTKKSKRKVGAEARPLQEPVPDEEPAPKKKKKAESKSRSGQETPKGDSRVENKKQSICMKKSTKKKTLKHKSSRKSSKAAQKGTVQQKPAQTEPPQVGPALPDPPPPPPSVGPGEVIQVTPAEVEVAGTGPPPAPPPPPPAGPAGVVQVTPSEVEVIQVAPAEVEVVQVAPAEVEVVQVGPEEKEPPPPPVEPAKVVEVVPAEVEFVQVAPAEVEVARPDEMEPPPPPPPPVGPLEVVHASPAEVQVTAAEVARLGPDEKEPPPPVEPIPKRSPRKESDREKPDLRRAVTQEAQVLVEGGPVPVQDGACGQDLSPPPPLPGELPKEEASGDRSVVPAGGGGQEARLGTVEAEEAEEAVEGPAGLGAAIELSAQVPSSEHKPREPEREPPEGARVAMDSDGDKAESAPGRDPASRGPAAPGASPPVTTAAGGAPDVEEDEGIHSHDGSDLSDNVSEDSDDSGLNGARPAPQETRGKSGKDASAAGGFVCIFCDRAFRKERDYSRHLHRHLVNVYFLEKAAQGQE